MKRQPLESITLSLKVLLWVVAIPAVLATVLLALAVWDCVDDMDGHSHSVVVAKTDLPGGTMLTTNTLARQSFKCAELKTDDWVARGDAEVLLGHSLLSDVKKGQVIEWHNTDIVITNQGSPQPTPAGDSVTRAEDGAASGAPEE